MVVKHEDDVHRVYGVAAPAPNTSAAHSADLRRVLRGIVYGTHLPNTPARAHLMHILRDADAPPPSPTVAPTTAAHAGETFAMQGDVSVKSVDGVECMKPRHRIPSARKMDALYI